MLSFTRGVKQNVFQRTFLVPGDLMSLTQQISVAFASPRSLKMRNQAVSWFNSLQDFQTPARRRASQQPGNRGRSFPTTSSVKPLSTSSLAVYARAAFSLATSNRWRDLAIWPGIHLSSHFKVRACAATGKEKENDPARIACGLCRYWAAPDRSAFFWNSPGDPCRSIVKASPSQADLSFNCDMVDFVSCLICLKDSREAFQ